MLEVTFFDKELEVGTFDVQASNLFVGSIVDGMKFLSITLNPPTGEDAIATIEYV